MRKYRSGLRQIKARVDRLKKDFPDSRFGDKAEALLKNLVGED